MSSSSKTEMAAYYRMLSHCARTGESAFIRAQAPRIRERIRQYLAKERKRRVQEIEEQRDQENQTAALQGRLPVWPEGALIPEDQVVIKRQENGILLEFEDTLNTVEAEYNTERGPISIKLGDLIECRHIESQALETYSLQEGDYTQSARDRAKQESWDWYDFRNAQRQRGESFTHFDEDFHRKVNSFLPSLGPEPSLPSEPDDEQPFGDSIFWNP